MFRSNILAWDIVRFRPKLDYAKSAPGFGLPFLRTRLFKGTLMLSFRLPPFLLVVLALTGSPDPVLSQSLDNDAKLARHKAAHVAELSILSMTDHKAVLQVKELAVSGDPYAQQSLGSMYRLGNPGVPKNRALALRWLAAAANQGNVRAQYALGTMYGQGEGGPIDHSKAIKWFLKAAEQGHAESQTASGAYYEQGWGVPRSKRTALGWQEKAAEQNIVLSQTWVGAAYWLGTDGIERDLIQGGKWSIIAKINGNAHAATILEAIEAISTPAQSERSKALAAEWLALHPRAVVGAK